MNKWGRYYRGNIKKIIDYEFNVCLRAIFIFVQNTQKKFFFVAFLQYTLIHII